MPDFKETNQLLLFLVFFIPGFVSLKVSDLFIATPRRDFGKILVEVVGYSALNWAPLVPVLLLVPTGYLPWIAFLGCFVLPVVWPLIWQYVRGLNFVRDRIIDPTPRPWDHVFLRRPRYYVVVTLKSGKQFAGTFGNMFGDPSRSFASSYPEPEQIYLERQIRLDESGHFAEWVPDSRGIVILSDIQTVELFWPEPPAPEENEL